ncbi:MAG: hisA/hisF family protein [Planctomycetes bacterium]|nr:hisA/hisF family protein [Planctomycetota bacterium]
MQPILPVLDVMNGQVVRGIAGRRDEYRPLVSALTGSTKPLDVALAFRKHFGFDECYLADLDAIMHQRPAFDIYRELTAAGFQLWIDAGLHTSRDDTLVRLMEMRTAAIIIGLESVDGPDELRAIVDRAGAANIVFSLDLKAGKPLSTASQWGNDDPWQIALHALDFGVRRLIVLDLARVGVGEGVGTDELCVRLNQTHPKVQLIAGGGVRGIEDVTHLVQCGVDRVLVASALHDGRILPDSRHSHVAD